MYKVPVNRNKNLIADIIVAAWKCIAVLAIGLSVFLLWHNIDTLLRIDLSSSVHQRTGMRITSGIAVKLAFPVWFITFMVRRKCRLIHPITLTVFLACLTFEGYLTWLLAQHPLPVLN